MIVVSDTSPLAYLVAIGVADALPQLYGEVYVPPTVAAELRHSNSPAFVWMADPPSWLLIQAPAATVDVHLDAGEREAIALALELGASRILIDELRGRAAARSLGLHVTGTLAVIIDAAERRLIDGHAALDRLGQSSFYASGELMEYVRGKLPPR